MNEPDLKQSSQKLNKLKVRPKRSFAARIGKSLKPKCTTLQSPATKKSYFETMHISCKSDRYQSGHNYAGVILYQYNGKSDWRTANETHYKSGYIVIQDTDSEIC